MKNFKNITAAALAAVVAAAAPLAGAVNNVLSVTASAEETEELWYYLMMDDGTISLTEYGGTKTNVVIPSTYDGKTVSQLNDSFFESENGRNKITSLTIPANMEIGGDRNIQHNGDITWRFGNMLALESISITGEDEYYSTVDGVLFNKDQTKLKYYPNAKKDSIYTIPDTVEYIDWEAFYTTNDDYFSFKQEELLKRTSYPSLKCIKLSNNIEIDVRDSNPFQYCSALTEIKVNDDNPHHAVVEGVLFNKDMTTLLAYPSAKADTSYNVPEGVRGIESCTAFPICPTLTSISLPKSVFGLGIIGSTSSQYVFDSCVALEEINVDEENTRYCSDDGVLFNKDKTILRRYPRAKKDLEYEIPDGVTRLDEGAFKDCTSLTKVSIPNSVTEGMVNRAFQDCTGLTEIVYEGSQEEWDELVDPYSDNLDNVKVTFVEPTTSDPTTSTPTTSEPKEFNPVSIDENLDEETKAVLNGITVTDSNGAFEDGVVMNVSNIEKAVGMFSFDVTFTKDGKEVQPKEKVTVKMPVPEHMKNGEIYVYHYDNNDKATLISSKIEDGFVIFETDSFSTYMLTSKKIDMATPGETDSESSTAVDNNTGSDQKPTGAALAIFPVVLAAGAVIVISKKRK